MVGWNRDKWHPHSGGFGVLVIIVIFLILSIIVLHSLYHLFHRLFCREEFYSS